MRKLLALSAVALAIAGCSDDSSEDVTNSLGQITISGTAEAGETLTATVTDENGISSATIGYSWMADGTAISNATSSTFTITEAYAGGEISVSASYTDDDGFDETVNSSAVTVANETAVIAGDLTGEIAFDATEALTGTATVTDADGADEFEPVTDEQSTYGSFSIDASGAWTYTLDTANETVAGLIDSNLTDSIFINAADGSPATITITITGGSAVNNVVKVTDTVDDDNGEVYYQLKESLADDVLGLTSGMISLSILYGELETETAYISLYESEGSTSTVIGELSLNEGAFALRENTFDADTTPSKANSASSSTNEDLIDAPDFTAGEWIDVAMSWDTTSATGGTYTVVIDGTTYGPFVSQFPVQNTLVESISVRLSSKSAIAPDAIYVDNLKIYSDAAGTTEIFNDDFEGYTAGDELDTDLNSDSPYGSRTFEAEIVDFNNLDGGTGDNGDSGDLQAGDVAPGTAGNKVALIQDEMDDDAGELRYKLTSSNTTSMISNGRLTVSFKKSDAASCTVGDAVKDAYISVYNSSTSSYNALVDLRIAGSDYDTDYAIRKNNVDGDKTVDIATSVAAFTADTWTNVEITWDAANATSDVGPEITVAINGVDVAAPWTSYAESLDDVITGASTFAFKLGDTSANMADCMFYVDNIKIYSSDTTADELVWSENFENYSDGDDLDASPFHSNTADAEVDVE